MPWCTGDRSARWVSTTVFRAWAAVRTGTTAEPRRRVVGNARERHVPRARYDTRPRARVPRGATADAALKPAVTRRVGVAPAGGVDAPAAGARRAEHHRNDVDRDPRPAFGARGPRPMLGDSETPHRVLVAQQRAAARLTDRLRYLSAGVTLGTGTRTVGDPGSIPTRRDLWTSGSVRVLRSTLRESEPVPTRWEPVTEDDIRTAASGGLLEETHYVELKRAIPQGAGANKELARDIASLAVDGGLLLVGIDEETEPPSLTPLTLAGLPERIEQVARSLIDEPLPLRLRTIPATGSPAEGYVAISVPVSARAPHMVDGRYYGRGDKTKHQLSDAEVSTLMARRQEWERDVKQRLAVIMSADPVPEELRQNGHLFVLATPVAAPEDLLVDVIPAEGWQRELLELVLVKTPTPELSRNRYSPEIREASTASRRSDGWAVTTYGFGPGRTLTSDFREDGLVELEIAENGELRLFCGRAVVSREQDERQGPTRWLFDVLVVGLVLHILAVAKTISDSSHRVGSWDFAVGITDMANAAAWRPASIFPLHSSLSSANVYSASTRTTTEELAQHPEDVAQRLLGRLLRSLGVPDVNDKRRLGNR